MSMYLDLHFSDLDRNCLKNSNIHFRNICVSIIERTSCALQIPLIYLDRYVEYMRVYGLSSTEMGKLFTSTCQLYPNKYIT